MKYITRTIWVLSLVSLFNDIASEMLYPVMPLYLKTINFSVVLIGILEGLAEATAGLSKGYFGKLSDVSGRRMPFVRIGYILSAVSKPMMAIFKFPLWIFTARTMDRFGKGIRTGARDAILSDEGTIETKGKVFGFHRMMDTFGAVLGPSLALTYLYFYPEDYKTLFFISFLPGIFAVLTTFFIKEKKLFVTPPVKKTSLFSFMNYWTESPAHYRKLVIGLLAFTLFNGSDVFLLLKAKQAGLNDTMIIGVYIFYNLIYALFSLPLGILADKFGLKTIYISGLVLFSVVYFGMSWCTTVYELAALFFLYGLYSAATEGISKAWISNISDKKDTATAIGTFSGFQSIFTMLASSITGIIWYKYDAVVALNTTAIATALVLVYFIFIPRPRSSGNAHS